MRYGAGMPTPANPQKFAVSVQPSLIDGMGEIRGESISVREARRRAKQQQRIMIVEVSDKRAIDASGSEDPMRYTNHSCSPNTVLRIQRGRVEFYALRNIAEGEELTANYGETHHEGKLTCRCGAPNCVGSI